MLLGQRLVDKLLKQLAELIQGDSVARLNYLTREELPLLLWHLLRDLVKQVDARILHDLLMQRAVGRPVIVQCVLPARRELARLAFAILNILAEVYALLR